MSYLKDALMVLFGTKEKVIIALLLIAVGGFAVDKLIDASKKEIKNEIEVIEEELQEDEVEAAIEMTKTEWMLAEQEEQIKALWIQLERLENEHKRHLEKRKH